MRGGCYTTEFGRGSGRGGVGAGKGGSWMAWHLDGLDRVAFMVYFWFGWNNRMGVSGGRVDAVLGREQDRTGAGTGSWDLEYREKLVGVRGKSLLHNSSLHSFSFFPLFPLAIWTSVGTCECPASFPPSSPDIGPQTQQRQPFAPPPLPQRISEDRILNTAQTGSTPTSKRRKMARCKHKLPPQHVGVCRRSNWVQGGGEDDVASGVRPRMEAFGCRRSWTWIIVVDTFHCLALCVLRV